MTRRLSLVLLTLFVPLWLHAGEVLDRDVLLTPDGTLYTVQTEWARDHSEITTSSPTVILLTVQQDGKSTTTVLPDSLNGGIAGAPVLAYDADSDSLFVFWQRMQNAFSSDMMLCAYQHGRWGDPTAIDSAGLHIRGNLRISVTQKFEQAQADGSTGLSSGLTVHAIWWDETGSGQFARYAMVTIENGAVTGIDTRNLLDFVPPEQQNAYAVDATFNRELLRHPAVFESSTHSSVDVVFADWANNAFHRVTLKPVANGRLRVPVGSRSGGFGPPRNFVSDINGRVTILPNASSEKLVFYFPGKDSSVNYMIEGSGSWSTLKSISMSDNPTASAAVVDALRRMISSQ
jgi:hypothetical protein